MVTEITNSRLARLQRRLRDYTQAWKDERKHRDYYEQVAITAKSPHQRSEAKEQAKFYSQRMKNLVAQITEIRNLPGFEGSGRAAERRISGRKETRGKAGMVGYVGAPHVKPRGPGRKGRK